MMIPKKGKNLMVARRKNWDLCKTTYLISKRPTYKSQKPLRYALSGFYFISKRSGFKDIHGKSRKTFIIFTTINNI
jgi:hypothetical protein